MKHEPPRDGDVDLHGYFRAGVCLVCEDDAAMSCPFPSSDCQVKCGLESCAEEESKMTGKSCQPNNEAVLRLLQASSCFRGEVCGSLPCACAETLAAVRAEQDAKRIEELEAALRCISTPADVSKMKARIEGLERDLEQEVQNWKRRNRDACDMAVALRRIVSLDEKNVPKYAQEIAQAALQRGAA